MFQVNQKSKEAFRASLIKGALSYNSQRSQKAMEKHGLHRIIVNGLQLRREGINAANIDTLTPEQRDEFVGYQNKITDYMNRADAVWQALVPVMMLPGDNDTSIPEGIRQCLGIATTEPFADRLALAPEPIQKQWVDKYQPEYEYFMGLNAVII